MAAVNERNEAEVVTEGEVHIIIVQNRNTKAVVPGEGIGLLVQVQVIRHGQVRLVRGERRRVVRE